MPAGQVAVDVAVWLPAPPLVLVTVFPVTTTGSAGIAQSRPNGSSWEAAAVRVTANADISVTAYAVCAG